MPDTVVETYRSQLEGHPVLLFDGVCVFCNRTVQFLIRHDREAVLRFVPLESPLGQNLLAHFNAQQGPEGVILITNALTPSARLSRRTEAFSDAVQLLRHHGASLAKPFGCCPASSVSSATACSRAIVTGSLAAMPLAPSRLPTSAQESSGYHSELEVYQPVIFLLLDLTSLSQEIFRMVYKIA